MARSLLLAAIVSTGLFGTTAIQACDQCGGGLGYGFGLGYMYGSLDYRVPYFAAHPPVYYSAPVPRTYGHSPFAYPPHFRTPEIVAEVEPLEIVNPYVPSSATESKIKEAQTTKAKSSRPNPLVVINPYVKSPQVMTASHSL